MSKPSQKHLYIAATVACLTGALFGYSVGFIGGVLVLPSFQRHFHLNDLLPSESAAAQATTVSAWLLGALFGVPLGIPICSRWGRRSCLGFSAFLYVIGGILQLIDLEGNNNITLFDVGRLVNGLGLGAGTLVSPMYISEISPPSERGMLMSGYQTIIQLSALVGFWGAFTSNKFLPSSSDLQWQIPVAIQLLPGIFLFLGTFLIPETPRFLAETENFKAAEDALAWLRSLPRTDSDFMDEIEEIREAACASKVMASHQTSFLSEMKKKDVRKRLHVGVGLMIAQNMVGLNALNYYAPVIFMSAGFNTVSSSLFLTGLFGIVKVVSALAFMFFFVRIKGNRFWLKFGTTVCAVSMLVLAYCVRQMPPPEQAHEVGLTTGGVVSVLMVYLFAFSFGVSLGPISWNVCSEIFPLHINAKCCAITTCTQWLFQIVIASITPHLLASVGWATYLVYAIFCLLSLLWVTLYVPETRGVALGRAMNELFGVDTDAFIGTAEEEPMSEVEETTELLREHRRTSITLYT